MCRGTVAAAAVVLCCVTIVAEGVSFAKFLAFDDAACSVPVGGLPQYFRHGCTAWPSEDGAAMRQRKLLVNCQDSTACSVQVRTTVHSRWLWVCGA